MGFLDFLKKIFNNDKHNPKIIVQNFSKIYKDSQPLEVGLYYKEQALQNEKVKIEVNNKIYERKTNENGIAKLNINLNVGKYRANIKFDGTDEYNSATGYADIYVNPRIRTSDLVMDYKDGSKFTAILEDNNGNPISNVKTIMKINGKEYTRTTDNNGAASLIINLSPKQYDIETIVNNIKATNKIIVNKKKDYNHFGYWIFGRDMNNVDLEKLKNNGVTDVFLNYYAFEAHGEDQVLNWIQRASPMHVHIWMQCFYDGEWHNPKNTDFTNRINEAKYYSHLNGVYGIHLDYLRYPGNAYKTDGASESIINFVHNVKSSIKENTFLSCATMPESENKYYYGQDIHELGKICDVVIPMQYKGNYNAGKSWLEQTTKQLSSQAKIWSGIQSYKSDDDTTILNSNELKEDIDTCLNCGANGVILFRYGLAPEIKFK